MKRLSNLDMNKNQVLNMVVQALAAAPGSPVEGQIYYDTTAHRFYVYNNTTWLPTDVTFAIVGSSAPGDSAAQGSAASAARSDHVHGREAWGGAGSTAAFGDSAAAGTNTTPSRSDHKHAMPADPTGKPLGLTGAVSATRYAGGTADVAPTTGTFAQGDFVISQTGKVWVCTAAGSPGTWVQVGIAVTFATPTIALGSAAAAGSATTAVRSDATIAAFDTTAPTTSGIGDAAAVGTAAFAARRDHVHGREAQQRLDQLAAPTADVSLNSHKITNLLDPTGAQDAATKAYVDARAAGLDPKAAAVAATTAPLAANTYANGASGVGATLTANANGALAAIDGYTPQAGDRILVKNEATAANNGIYTVTQVGTGSLPYILTRATDFNSATTVVPGAFVFVETGTVNGSGGFILTGTGAWTLGTTAITFVQFTGAGEITAGTGLTKSGNTIGMTVAPLAKFAQDVGDGAATSYTITHNLGTRDVTVLLRDNTASGNVVECDIQVNAVNTVVLTFAVAPTSAQYRVIVAG